MMLKTGSTALWQVQPESKVSRFALWVKLRSLTNLSDTHWQLLFRDQLNQQDYRRVCRIIFKQQQSLRTYSS